MSNKLALMEKLKNTMKEVEWHSTFDFESYEINEEDKAFIEQKEELISNNFKKYSSSKYEICLALVDVKTRLKENESSFMAWYTHLGLTKDKVSELLKTYELYIQAPHMKDYISSLSGLAVKLLTHKDVSPQIAMDIMELGVKNSSEIKELLELQQTETEKVKVKNVKTPNFIRKLEKKIKNSDSVEDLKTAKKELEELKFYIKELEKDIHSKEVMYMNKNNEKLWEE